MLMDKRLDRLEVLATDNCLMMIRNHIRMSCLLVFLFR
jgi:hypothetical protein